jgi:hypothetical protein
VLAHDPDELEEDQGPYTSDAAGLLRFLEGEILPWYAMRRTELANRPLICAQAFGETLEPDRLNPSQNCCPPESSRAEPYAGGQGQRGSVRLGNPRLPSLAQRGQKLARQHGESP